MDRRSRSFLECWTRKEALIKAQGGGVWLGLDRFVVAFGTEPARVVRIDGHPDAASRWSLLDLEPGSASVGALALESAAPPPVRAGRIDPTAGPVPGLDSRGEEPR